MTIKTPGMADSSQTKQNHAAEQDWLLKYLSPAPLLAASAAALIFALIAYGSIELTRGDGRIAAVWVPNAMALAVLLRFRIPNEPLFVFGMWIGNLSANVAAGDTIGHALALASCNMLEITIALIAIRATCGPRPDLLNINDLVKFTVIAGLAAPAVPALLATLTLGVGQPLVPMNAVNWAITDGLGMIIVAPTMMILIDAVRSPTKPSPATVYRMGRFSYRRHGLGGRNFPADKISAIVSYRPDRGGLCVSSGRAWNCFVHD